MTIPVNDPQPAQLPLQPQTPNPQGEPGPGHDIPQLPINDPGPLLPSPPMIA